MPKAKAPAPLTASQLHQAVADDLGCTKKEAKAFFEALEKQIKKGLNSPAGKVNAIPGLLVLNKKDVKAKPAREGRNPFSGETMMFKAKPASKSVRASVRKRLKDMV